MTIRRAMLMAAGLGTRLQPITLGYPKALVPLLGVPMAQFAVDSLVRAGVEEIVANIHYHPERAEAGLRALEFSSRTSAARLIISDEKSELLGSGGGIRKALPHFQDNGFFLVNADVLSDIDLRDLGSYHEMMRRKCGVTITLAVLPGGPGFYREISYDPVTGMIDRLGEVVSGKPYYMGAAVLEPEALRKLKAGPAEFVPQILEPAVKNGKACAYPVNCFWRDVGTPKLWFDAHLSILNALETGLLARALRSRIEAVNRRVGDRIWVDRDAPAIFDHSEWVGPCYLGAVQRSIRMPRALGPYSFVYGSDLTAHGPGIGAFGHWLPMTGLHEKA